MAVILRDKVISHGSRILGEPILNEKDLVDTDSKAEIGTIDNSTADLLHNHDTSIAELEPDLYASEVSNVETIDSNARYDSLVIKSEELEAKLARYEQEFSKLEELAKHDGFKAGYEEGLEKAQGELEIKTREITEQLNVLLQNIANKVEDDITNLGDILLDVTMASISKVLGHELKNKKNIASIIQNVINLSVSKTNVVVRLSREDYNLLRNNNIKLVNEDEYENLKIIPDDRVTLGGCILETESGTLDGRLETQLTNLHNIILSAKETLDR